MLNVEENYIKPLHWIKIIDRACVGNVCTWMEFNSLDDFLIYLSNISFESVFPFNFYLTFWHIYLRVENQLHLRVNVSQQYALTYE